MGSVCDPASPLLGIHLKEIMGQESKDVYTGMFLSRPFIIVNNRGLLKLIMAYSYTAAMKNNDVTL